MGDCRIHIRPKVADAAAAATQAAAAARDADRCRLGRYCTTPSYLEWGRS
jgi:hypothetical protein